MDEEKLPVGDDTKSDEPVVEIHGDEDSPELEYIIDLVSELQDSYRGDDEQIKRMRAVRDGTFEVAVPPEALWAPEVIVRAATIQDEAQRLPAMFYVNEPTITVTPPRETDALQSLATKIEKWTRWGLWEAGNREVGATTLERVIDMTCNDGGGWSKLTFNNTTYQKRYAIHLKDFKDDPIDPVTGVFGKTAAEKYDDAVEDAKRLAGVPFDWIAVDPLCIYPVFHGREIGEIVEVQERPLNQTFRRYKLAYAGEKIVDAEFGGPDWRRLNTARQTVTFVQHWTKTWCTELVLDDRGGRRILKQWRHGLPGIPYFHSISLAKGYERNRKIGMAISETKRELVQYLSFLRTMNAQQAIKEAIPPIFEETPADSIPIVGDDGKPRSPEAYQLGVKYTLPPGSRISSISFPQNMDKIQSEIALVQRDIEKMEPPRPAGEIGNLQGAGFAISSILTEGKVRFAPVGAAIERHMEAVTKFLWAMVVHKIGEPVYVDIGAGGKDGIVSCSPSDLAKPFRIKWDLNPEAPSAKVVEERYWASRVQNGTASNDMAIEAMGGNPDEVRFGRALDRIRQSPAYQAQEEAAVWAEIGRGDRAQLQQYAEAIAQLKQQAQTGTPPPDASGGQQPMQGVSGGQGQGMAGQPGTPDFAALASSPNGTGAEGVGPGPGGFPGMPSTPTAAATAQIQDIGS